MRKHHTLGAILAASALVVGGGLAAASGETTVPGTEPAGTEPAGTEPAGTEPAGTEPAGSAAPAASAAPAGEAVEFETGLEFNSVLLPKFTGIAVFDQANEGAQEAAAELGATPAEFLGPTADNSVAGQIEIMTNAATQGVNAVMLSNNAGDQIVPAAQSVVDAGGVVVTWDSPIPTAEGESVFVAQVDFDETGQVMADMSRSILGDDGGQMAILSASPDAANQNAWIAAFEEVIGGDGLREHRGRRHRLRQRRVGGVLRAGPEPRRPVPGPRADHGPDDGRHRRRRQGDAGRGSVRPGQGLRPGSARRDA